MFGVGFMVFECVMIENAELLFLMNDEPSVMVEDREACVVRHLAPEKFFFFETPESRPR